MASIESLFGYGDGLSEPWHQFYKCECKEVSQETVDFLHCTAGIHGDKHPMHGWIIDMKLWSALLQYLSWCADEQLDYRFHVDRVQEGDEYYIRMVFEKLKLFGCED